MVDLRNLSGTGPNPPDWSLVLWVILDFVVVWLVDTFWVTNIRGWKSYVQCGTCELNAKTASIIEQRTSTVKRITIPAFSETDPVLQQNDQEKKVLCNGGLFHGTNIITAALI